VRSLHACHHACMEVMIRTFWFKEKSYSKNAYLIINFSIGHWALHLPFGLHFSYKFSWEVRNREDVELQTFHAYYIYLFGHTEGK
jgi:hypothetical protein